MGWTRVIHAVGKRVTDDVVFGEPGDLMLLGARSLEGLNLRVEPATRQLVDAGPMPAAMVVAFLMMFFGIRAYRDHIYGGTIS